MSEYRPFQHQSRPQGCKHETIFANVELWVDKPPAVIVLGDFRYRLERTYTSDDVGAVIDNIARQQMAAHNLLDLITQSICD